jgi:hypothetical protein
MADKPKGRGKPARRYTEAMRMRNWDRWGDFWSKIGYDSSEITNLLYDNVIPSSPIGRLLARTRKIKIQTYQRELKLSFEEAVQRAKRFREAAATRHDYESDYIWAELYSVDPETRSKYGKLQANWQKKRGRQGD